MGNKIEVLIAQGLDVPNFFGCTKGTKVRSEVGNNLQSLSKVVQRNKWTMGRKSGVLLAQGFDVSNFLKNVPRVPKSIYRWGMASNNFSMVLKWWNDIRVLIAWWLDILIFLMDVIRVPMLVSRWGMTFNHFLMIRYTKIS